MATQRELDIVYMNMALGMASLSKSNRKRVGAIGVTTQGVILTGVNGLPSALGNELEFKGYGSVDLDELDQNNAIYQPRDHQFVINVPDKSLITKPTVIHAELNVLLKAAREGVSIVDSTFYITLSACEACASMLIAAGVKRVVYLETYRIPTGVDILLQGGIIVDKLEF